MLATTARRATGTLVQQGAASFRVGASIKRTAQNTQRAFFARRARGDLKNKTLTDFSYKEILALREKAFNEGKSFSQVGLPPPRSDVPKVHSVGSDEMQEILLHAKDAAIGLATGGTFIYLLSGGDLNATLYGVSVVGISATVGIITAAAIL